FCEEISARAIQYLFALGAAFSPAFYTRHGLLLFIFYLAAGGRMCLFTRFALWASASSVVKKSKTTEGAECKEESIRNHSLHFGRIRVAYQIAAAQLALALLVLRGQDVAQKRMPRFHFPGCSFLKALRGALVSL